MQRRMGILIMVLGLAAVLLVAGGAVLAHTGPVNAGVIHACLNNGGQLKIVGANDTCPGAQTPLDWNATGPQGPQGPPGGVSGLEKISSSVTPDTTGFAKTTSAICPSPKKVLGGGVRALGGGSRTVIGSFPSGAGNAWIGEVKKSVSSDALGLTVFAICATTQ